MLNLLPNLNDYASVGYKTKSINALKAKTLADLYHVILSQSQNPSDVVLRSKEPATFLTKLQPKFPDFNNHQIMMALDQITYLPNDILVKVDRTSMASSVETRVPFLDHRIVEYSWKIPHSIKFRNGKSKWILRKILKNYVPENLTDRPKKGFGIPLNDWLKGPLKDWAENLLDEKKTFVRRFFNSKIIRQKWEDYLSNKNKSLYDLWNVLMFQAWRDQNN